MLKSFAISEPEGNQFAERWDDILRLQDGRPVSPLVIVLRTLSGNVDLVHISSGKRRKCRTVYFSARKVNSRRPSYPTTLAKWMSEEIGAEDVIRYLRYARSVNRNFYAKIAAETCFCLEALDKRNYLSAFVNVYRLVEWTSFAFPNIYFSASDDFLGSYNELKKMMQENANGGELAFFKKSLATLFRGDPNLELTYDFEIPSTDKEVCKTMLGQVKAMCDNAAISIESEPDSNKFTIAFLEMPSFIVTLRNRYFHYDGSGRQNIDIDKIRDIDLLFETVTEPSLRWFSTVLLRVVARSVGFHAAVARAPA